MVTSGNFGPNGCLNTKFMTVYTRIVVRTRISKNNLFRPLFLSPNFNFWCFPNIPNFLLQTIFHCCQITQFWFNFWFCFRMIFESWSFWLLWLGIYFDLIFELELSPHKLLLLWLSLGFGFELLHNFCFSLFCGVICSLVLSSFEWFIAPSFEISPCCWN